MKRFIKQCHKDFSILAIVLVLGSLGIAACSAARQNRSSNETAVTQQPVQSQIAGVENNQAKTEVDAAKTPAKQNAIFASFKKGDDYQKVVRPKILAEGWEPAPEEDADTCGSGNDNCDKFPEMNHCAGTGMGNCEFRWQKNGQILQVFTVDEPQVFDSYEIKKSSKQSGESAPKDADLVGKYVYTFTDEGGGSVSFDLQTSNVAVFNSETDDVFENGQGSWNWDSAKELLTVNLPSVKTTFAEDEGKPTFSKRTIILKGVGKNLTITKIIPASAGGTGGIFKKQ